MLCGVVAFVVFAFPSAPITVGLHKQECGKGSSQLLKAPNTSTARTWASALFQDSYSGKVKKVKVSSPLETCQNVTAALASCPADHKTNNRL